MSRRLWKGLKAEYFKLHNWNVKTACYLIFFINKIFFLRENITPIIVTMKNEVLGRLGKLLLANSHSWFWVMWESWPYFTVSWLSLSTELQDSQSHEALKGSCLATMGRPQRHPADPKTPTPTPRAGGTQTDGQTARWSHKLLLIFW
jgi:hypothetical protein